MQDFSLTQVSTPLALVSCEADASDARSAVVVALLAERDGDDVRVSPVVVSDQASGPLLRVVRDRGPGYSTLVPAKDIQGLPGGDVAALAKELSAYNGQPRRMVGKSRP